ncbi:MAG: hypothetical protein AB7G93_03180 [Bdellovibrionales bacterium]
MRRTLMLLAVSAIGLHVHAELTGLDVLMLKDKYTFDILKDERVAELVGDTLTSSVGNNGDAELRAKLLADLEQSLAVASPATVAHNRFLIATGCEAHNCGGGDRALFVIDAQNPSAMLIVRKNVTDIVAKPEKEATALIANGEWMRKMGIDGNTFPSELRSAISDL